MLLIPGVALGTALVFVQRHTGAQASNSSACGGIPDGGNEFLHQDIRTTTFAGCKDGACADPNDNCLGSSGISTGCNAPTEYFAALPLSEVAAKCNGSIENCSRIQVINPKTSKSVVLAVVDTGPCNTSDREYVMGTSRPAVESGSKLGGCANQYSSYQSGGEKPAALDISSKARDILGGGNLSWKFTNLVLGENSSSSGCSEGHGCMNVTLFKQYKPPWASQSYGCGGTTIESSGCGPTSVAMVLKFYGIDVDPSVTANFCLQNDYRKCEAGTKVECFSALAKKYGLKYEIVDWTTAQQLLKDGKPLIVGVKGPSKFTSGGHFIVLTCLNNNTVSINDPGPNDITTATTGELLGAFSSGYYYIHP